MIRRIAHIAIATDSIAVTSQFYKSLGRELDRVEVVSDQKVKVAVMKIGDSAIEFIEPTDSDSPISSFLSRRGNGLHHISLEVDDLASRLEDLKARNVRLIDEQPPGRFRRPPDCLHSSRFHGWRSDRVDRKRRRRL